MSALGIGIPFRKPLTSLAMLEAMPALTVQSNLDQEGSFGKNDVWA